MILRSYRPTIIALIAGLLALLASFLVSTAFTGESGAAQALQGVTSLSVDDCVEIDVGETVELEILVSGVSQLIAWEIYYAYDRDLLEVVNRDVRRFLSRGPNSNVFDLSDPVPNSTGLYRLAAADVALNATAETGTGVITTVFLRARDEGVSPSAIYRSSSLPLGPRLTSEGGTAIGDTDGDGIFDGSIKSGQIAIGRPCRATPPTPDPDVEDFVVTPTSGSPPTTGRPGDAGEETPGPGPTDDRDGTATDGDSPDGDSPDGDSPDGGTPDPGEPSPDDGEGDGDEPDSTQHRSERPGGADGGGIGGSGIGSSGDNTFWAIVLIGGGVTLGLVATYFLARMTRRPV